MLDKKLQEEVDEYYTDKSIGELADILEVIYSIVKSRGYSIGELEKIRKEKKEKRGSFDNKILLLEVIESEL